MAVTAKSIIIVGAGIIGASIAFHCARAGHSVTILARDDDGPASSGSFAWINASWGNPEIYYRLRKRAMEEWQRLAVECPDIPVNFSGSLCFDLDDEDLASYAREHGSWGYDITTIAKSDIASIEPNLLLSPNFALQIASEGACEPNLVAKALIADALSHGARQIKSDVSALIASDGRVTGVMTATGTLMADEIVLAAGKQTAALAATIGIDVPIDCPPGLIVHSRPHAKLLNGLVIAPELHLRQTAEGRIIAGSDFGGSEPGEEPARTAELLFEKVKKALKGGDELAMDFFTIAQRPTPRDGYPIVGRAPGTDGLYLAVMHSGVTNAPAIGLFAARELSGEPDEALLSPYRLARFAAKSQT